MGDQGDQAAQAAIVNLKRKLAGAEKTLQQKLFIAKRLLPALCDVNLTPNSSCNTTFDGPRTPSSTPTVEVSRRDEQAMAQPFYLNEQLRALKEAFNSLDKTVEDLGTIVDLTWMTSCTRRSS